jgi:hypothetical protein
MFYNIGYVEATKDVMLNIFGKDFDKKGFFDVVYNGKSFVLEVTGPKYVKKNEAYDIFNENIITTYTFWYIKCNEKYYDTINDLFFNHLNSRIYDSNDPNDFNRCRRKRVYAKIYQ